MNEDEVRALMTMTKQQFEQYVDPFEEMDRWCEKRAAALSEKAGHHIMIGGKLDAPKYRTILGKHQAYMAMRSFIKGARRNTGGLNG